MTKINGTAAYSSGPAAAQLRDTGHGKAISLESTSTHEAITRQLAVGVHQELGEIKARLNGLLVLVAGSLLFDVALRLLGGGR